MNRLHALFKQAATVAVVILPSVFMPPVLANEFSMGVGLAEIYSSNLFLDPSGFEESEFITEVAPFVGLSHYSERIEYDIDYTFQMLLYAGDSDLNGGYSDLSSLGFIDLIGDELRLRGLARMAQVNIDPDRKVSGGNYNIIRNRSDVTRWEVGPDWNQDVWGRSEVDAYFYAGDIEYKNPTTSDLKTQRGQFILRTGKESISPVNYRLFYDYLNFDYVTREDIKRQELYLRLDYDIASEFRIFGLIGRDSNLGNSVSSGLDEQRWEVGFATAGRETRLEAAVGKRYFGTTYRFEFERVSEFSLVRVSYRESPGTVESFIIEDEPRGTSVVGDSEPLDEVVITGLESFGSGERYARKRAEASIRLKQYRSATLFRTWWEERDILTQGSTNNLTQTEKTVGFAFNFAWDVGDSTVTNVNLEWRVRDIPGVGTDPVTGEPVNTSREDILWRIYTGVNYQLGLSTLLTLNLGYEDRGDDVDSINIDYEQFIAILRLTREF